MSPPPGRPELVEDRRFERHFEGAASKHPFSCPCRLDWGAATPLVFDAVATSVVTVWLWMTGLKHVPAASAGVFAVMLPISAAAVVVAVLGEPCGAVHAVAFVLALVGVVLALRGGTVPP